jgi:hypothetical protein
MIHPASTHPATVQHHQQSQLNRLEDKFVFSIENIFRPDPLPDKREQITPLPLVSWYRCYTNEKVVDMPKSRA